MILTKHITDQGVPATGLSPLISIWTVSGQKVINEQSMTEIAGGFYKFDFSNYDATVDYCILVDGGATLSNTDRYKTIEEEILCVKRIEVGAWELIGNQLIYYNSDDTTPLLTFNTYNQSSVPSMINVYKRVPTPDSTSYLEMVDDLEMTDDLEMI